MTSEGKYGSHSLSATMARRRPSHTAFMHQHPTIFLIIRALSIPSLPLCQLVNKLKPLPNDINKSQQSSLVNDNDHEIKET